MENDSSRGEIKTGDAANITGSNFHFDIKCF